MTRTLFNRFIVATLSLVLLSGCGQRTAIRTTPAPSRLQCGNRATIITHGQERCLSTPSAIPSSSPSASLPSVASSASSPTVSSLSPSSTPSSPTVVHYGGFALVPGTPAIPRSIAQTVIQTWAQTANWQQGAPSSSTPYHIVALTHPRLTLQITPVSVRIRHLVNGWVGTIWTCHVHSRHVLAFLSLQNYQLANNATFATLSYLASLAAAHVYQVTATTATLPPSNALASPTAAIPNQFVTLRVINDAGQMLDCSFSMEGTTGPIGWASWNGHPLGNTALIPDFRATLLNSP